MRTAPPRQALLAAVLLLAACPGPDHTPPPPPPPPTELTASGNAYQLIAGSSYASTGFNLRVPALGADERLALLVTNSGTTSTTAVSLTSTATSGAVGMVAGPLEAARMANPAGGWSDPRQAARGAAWRGHELARARRERFLERGAAAGATVAEPRVMAPFAAVQPAATAAVNDIRNFCVYDYNTGVTTAQPATLRYLSDDGAGGHHAQFWMTDATWSAFQAWVLPLRPDFWTSLGNAYEQKVLPALGASFGAESDVDGNQQVIFLFANLGGSSASGFVVGYFDPYDVYYTRDATCSGSGSNGADMLYLLDPVSFATNWDAPPGSLNFEATLGTIVDEEVPATMAHELQHNVNFNTRCLANRSRCSVAPPACPGEPPYKQAENTWINEGLSMVATDVAGYGLAYSVSRAEVRQYLDTYQSWSLTCWEGDPVGNYGAVHAYMRYWLDQQGPGFTLALEDPTRYGKANVANAIGMSFDAGFAQFAAASLVSNEDTARYPSVVTAAGNVYAGSISSLGDVLSEPRFNYGAFQAGGALDPVQPPWMPWHHYTGSCSGNPKDRTANVNYTPFDPAHPVAGSPVRGDGWGAFVTRGTGADATIQFRSTGSVRPSVALVRYTGALPNASFAGCP